MLQRIKFYTCKYIPFYICKYIPFYIVYTISNWNRILYSNTKFKIGDTLYHKIDGNLILYKVNAIINTGYGLAYDLIGQDIIRYNNGTSSEHKSYQPFCEGFDKEHIK